mgnify:FL=1
MKNARTRSIPFYCKILAVNAGIEIAEAVEEAGNIVNAALDTLKGVACGLSGADGGNAAWTSSSAPETADGLLHAIAAGLLDLDHEGESEQGEALRLELTDQELSHLRAVAEQEGADLPSTAARLLGQAVREHAAHLVGGEAQ